MKGRSIVASVVVHGLFFALLLVASAPVARIHKARPNTTFIAPSLIASKPPRNARRLHLPSKLRTATLPPAAAHLTLPRIELPLGPQLEISRRVAPVIPQQAPVILPPAILPPDRVVKNAEFIQAVPSTPKVVPQTPVEPSGFEAVGNAPSILARGKLSSPVTGFDFENAGNQSPRSHTLSQGSFGETYAAAAPATPRGAISRSSFGDTTVANAPAQKQLSASALTDAVEILAKPRPQYTSDARAAGVEGEVQVEVVFEATGFVRVLRVVKGLGFGLDETAQAAARSIQFRPARRDGAPVDLTAVVRILFQLAY